MSRREVDEGTQLSALFASAWGGSLAGLCEPHFELADGGEQALLAAAASDSHAEPRIVEQLESWLLARNQFLACDGKARGELAASVRQALKRLCAGGDLHETFARHRGDLCAFVQARLGPTPRDVVSAEYSPELQLTVLGLALDSRQAPVLDIGCGPSAALVRHLLERGVAAHGVDRSAPSDVATRVDWLRFDYGRGHYRTVLSHLGFSLHFLHHHLAGRDEAYEYARCYMTILRSLATGGCFAYTPPLPFLEPLLDPAMYRVRAVPLSSALRPGILGELERDTGLALASATQVERLA